MRAGLRGVSSREADEAGDAIARRLGASPGWQRASTVALYASLPGEVATTALIAIAREEGRRVLLPRVVDGERLVFVEHLAAVPLKAGAYGVSEPPENAAVVDLAMADLIVVPGVAFDRRGGRLGRGAGYYDRALADIGLQASGQVAADRDRDQDVPRTIGVAFERQLVEAVPMDERDVRMDAVVTPSAIHAVRRRDA